MKIRNFREKAKAEWREPKSEGALWALPIQWKRECKGAPSRDKTILRPLTVGASRDLPRTEIPVGRDVVASATFYGKIKTEPLPIELHPMKIESFPPRIEVIGPF